MVKKRWANYSKKKAVKPKKKHKTEQEHFHTRCENCHCYKCCRHFWICGDCDIKRDTFFLKWLNQEERKGRGGKGGSREGGK